MTAGLLHNRTDNSKCKQGFLCQGMEIGSQPVLSSLDQEFGGGGGNRKLQNVVEKIRK